VSATSIRTCVGCGRKAEQRQLLRFVAREGRLAEGVEGAGRGAYTCRRLPCFERARERRAFNRTLRRTVLVEPGLARLYTEGENGR